MKTLPFRQAACSARPRQASSQSRATTPECPPWRPFRYPASALFLLSVLNSTSSRNGSYSATSFRTEALSLPSPANLPPSDLGLTVHTDLPRCPLAACSASGTAPGSKKSSLSSTSSDFFSALPAAAAILPGVSSAMDAHVVYFISPGCTRLRLPFQSACRPQPLRTPSHGRPF